MLQQRVPDHGRRSTTYTKRSVSPTESSRAFSSSDRFFLRPVRLVTKKSAAIFGVEVEFQANLEAR